MENKELTILELAPSSKHAEAILLLLEKKHLLQEVILEISKEYPETVKKAFALLAEYLFTKTLNILLDEKNIDDNSEL